ncbi:MAG: hypothetical protein NC912_05705 [Candidatus Omnitrophica bacterium]|nr:hypothetical protein [Candidatus Omnitrophota bacterium]
MGVRARSLTLPLIILVSLALISAVFYLFQKEHTKNLALQQQLEETTMKYRRTELELKEARNKASELESELKHTRLQLDNLNQQLKQTIIAKEEALARVEELSKELDEHKLYKADLEKKLDLAQKDLQEVLEKLKDLSAEKKELESMVKEMETKAQKVELGKIVVTPEVTSSSQQVKDEAFLSNLEGEILVVNKDYDFVVTSLGSKDGIDVDNILAVYRKGKYLGDLKVERLHESMSAAGFVTEGLKDKINEGDTVVLKTQ